MIQLSYLNLKIGLPPVLKAGSSGTLFNALFNIFNFMHRSPNLFYNKLNSLINEINKQKITSNIILIIFLGDAHAHLVGFLGSCAAHNQGRKMPTSKFATGSCARA